MNLRNIGYIYFQEKDITKAKSSNRDFDNRFASSYFLGVCNFFMKFAYSLMKCRLTFRKATCGYNGCLVYGLSTNNRNTLMPIIEKYGANKIVSYIHPEDFPSWMLYWYSLPYLTKLVSEIRSASAEDRPLFKLFFPKFWRMYGCEKVARKMIEYHNAKVIVLANDHLEFNRALLNEAKKKKIPTIYVQHATVGYDFPPLTFEYSFLDGLDAYNKYDKIGGMEGNVYLSGGVRFDKIQLSQDLEKTNSIGVAINLVDDTEKIKEFIIRLKERLPEKDIVLRPHPQMSADMWISWCKLNRIGFSSPVVETSFEFIKGLDLIISNQCSIHLDSALCHKPSIVFNLAKRQPDDVYGFVNYGLVKYMDNMSAIVDFIENLNTYKINEDAVRYYNYAYNTKHEGHVSDMIADMIAAIINKKTESFNKRNGFKELYSDDKCKVYSYE